MERANRIGARAAVIIGERRAGARRGAGEGPRDRRRRPRSPLAELAAQLAMSGSLDYKLDRIVGRAAELRAHAQRGLGGDGFARAEQGAVGARAGGGAHRRAARGRAGARRGRGDAGRPRDGGPGRGRAARAEGEAPGAAARDPPGAAAARTRPTPAARSWKSARPPAATRPGCSPPSCSRCIRNTRRRRAGGSRCWNTTTPGSAASRRRVAEITGRNVFARLKYESGVHRVQRVPATESQGRIHTSTVTVAVLPEAEEVDVRGERERPAHRRLSRIRAPAGQHVNKTESAVRITHMPTGVVVAMQEERSQHKNRAKAMKILRARLYEAQRTSLAATRAADRKCQVGTGDRSERIRTYNFPQGRVSRPPHRPDAAQDRPGDAGRPGRDRRRADRRGPGRPARRRGVTVRERAAPRRGAAGGGRHRQPAAGGAAAAGARDWA